MPSDLDFISRPNPVEPSALSNGNLSSLQLDRSTNEHLMPFLLNNRPSQQRRDAPLEITKSSRHVNQTSGLPISDVLNKTDDTEHTPPRPDQTFYTLPKLPVKRGTKRHRVPPVLQGLHEPPPTARILPSISAEETQVLLPSTREHLTLLNESLFTEKDVVSISFESVNSEPPPIEGSASRKSALQRNKWTEQETNDLLRGVAKFGIGSWKKILSCSEFTFNKRTAVDLKDRFRVCKPSAYGNPRTKKAKRAQETKTAKTVASETLLSTAVDSASTKPATPAIAEADNVENTVALAEAQGETDAALWNVKRRKRRRFTEQEDEALLRGYDEHGASWQAISKDPIFQVTGRTPTDLRDRFRTRYPEHYARSGLVPRPATFPKPLLRSGASGEEQIEGSNTSTPREVLATALEISKSTPPAPSWQGPGVPSLAHRHHVLPLPRLADDFLPEFGFPDEDDEADGPIVLDRSIVDWANSNMPSSRPAFHMDNAVLPGIDPLITLNLPKPGLY